MSVAEAALARDKPLTALLLRYRPLLVKTVPERHVTLVVLKLVPTAATKEQFLPEKPVPKLLMPTYPAIRIVR